MKQKEAWYALQYATIEEKYVAQDSDLQRDYPI